MRKAAAQAALRPGQAIHGSVPHRIRKSSLRACKGHDYHRNFWGSRRLCSRGNAWAGWKIRMSTSERPKTKSGRFARLQERLTGASVTDRLPSVARAMRLLSAAFGQLTFAPVANGWEVSPESWSALPLRTDWGSDPLAKLSMLHEPTAQTFARGLSSTAPLNFKAAVTVLHGGMAIARRALGSPASGPQTLSFPSTLETAEFSRLNPETLSLVTRHTATIIASCPSSVSNIFLHGSIADQTAKLFYSDWDMHVICRVTDTAEELTALAEWLFTTDTPMLSFSPWMHHGPMIIFDDELRWNSAWTFPRCLMDEGIALKGNILECSEIFMTRMVF